MTDVLILGSEDVDLHRELLAYETSREALATYDLSQPYTNTIGLQTVSLGSAVALLNDINWHLARVADRALVKEPSITQTEWLSRDIAEAVRAEKLSPEQTKEYLMIYGVARESPADPGLLVEPMYTRRTDGNRPDYDLQDVEETVTVRLTKSEFQSGPT